MHTFKTLGEITLEQKQHIWKYRMSGSQVKRVFSDENQLWKEKMGLEEAIDLSQTRAKEALEWGHIMEPVILNRAKEVLGLDIKVDKDTFESTTDDFYTANIDGYIGEDINNVETIIEIKNTKEDSVNTILDRYYLQVAYYMWFFNAKNAKLIFLVQGSKLQVVDIARDYEFEKEMLEKLSEFKDSIFLGIAPSIPVVGEEEAELVLDDSKLDDGFREDIIDLEEANSKIAEYKKVKERIEAELKEEFAKFKHVKSKFTTLPYTFEKTITKRKGSVDTEAMLLWLAGQYGFDFKKVQDQFRKEDTESVSIKVKEIK